LEADKIKTLSILGSTGSIGESTFDLVSRFPDRFKVYGLAAGRRTERVAEQARALGVKLVSVADEGDALRLQKELGPAIEVCFGPEGLVRVASEGGIDMVVTAIVGAVGLRPTLAAVEQGIDIALANKETLVAAGELVMEAAKKSGARILPVDSEHSAIFQALDGKMPDTVKKIILTASGGPFRGWDAKRLETVTVKDALNHPNWSMGPKITIDSATLMNKGLEVIEAHWLFGIGPDRIDVTIHPQSIVHSMVEYIDGSIIAQLGVPDMRGPIGYALAYPGRLPTDELALDLRSQKPLTFDEPDTEAFPCLGLAYRALRAGGTASAVLSGANEIAVEAFLREEITFTGIARLCEETLDSHTAAPLNNLETALEADRWARKFARRKIYGNGGEAK
jgi:1-deoxy-D-xylulose-5-phosphate reductoisomerase